ncbi:MAG: PD-(D/E)XK nuclease family protein [Coriobacteriia bacterium]|nr:PD-(D/E)XK nuclease family protein [Coriobacteriia bacterium]
MALHLITGPANAGKTGLLNEHLFGALERGQSPTLVVPSVADERRARAELAQKAPVGVTITSTRRWIQRLWLGNGDGRRIVGNVAREALVRQAIDDEKPVELSGIAHTPGFVRLIASAVSAIEGDLEPETAPTAAMAEAVRICGRCRDLEVANGLVDFAEVVRSLTQAPPALDGPVLLNRFIAVDDGLVELCLSLSTSSDVVIALSWQEGAVASQALGGAVERLAQRAKSHVKPPVVARETEIDQVLQHLYINTPTAVRREDSVRFGVGTGVDAEAHLVADAVATALADGFRAERIAVAYPRLEEPLRPLCNALDVLGIAYDIDVTRALTVTPFGQAIGAVADLALGRADRATAMSALLGPFSDLSADEAIRLDAVWRGKRVEEPAMFRRDVLALSRTGQRLRKAVDLIRESAEGPLDAAAANKWQTALDLLLTSRLVGAHRAGIEPLESRVTLAEDAAASKALARTISEMAAVVGSPFTSLDVREGMPDIDVGGTKGEPEGRVQVTEFARIHSRRFDVLILAGLTSDEHSLGDPDSLGAQLRSLVGAPAPADEEAALRLTFHTMLSRARERIVLLRRGADESGTPVAASFMWDEVVATYASETDEIGEWPAAAPELVRLSQADIAGTAPAFTIGRQELRRRATEDVEGRRRSTASTLRDPEVLAQLAAKETFSASEIETYLSCPYRWFYAKLVNPQELDEQVDSRAYGTLAHGALADFYGTWGSRRVAAADYDAALEVMSSVFADRVRKLPELTLAEQVHVEQVERWVRTVISDDIEILPDFQPARFEESFGPKVGTPVTIGGVVFKGRIDRIDESAHGCFVTDYKTSSSVKGHGGFEKEGLVQPVVYALAAEALTGKPATGSMYRSIKSRTMRGFFLDSVDRGGRLISSGDACTVDEVARIIDGAEGRIARAVEGIRAGRIPREPHSSAACRYCDLASVCEKGGK